jgi:DNA recombination protein RmuC
MDVKFPWSHYVTLFDADSPEQRKIEKKQFIIDVKIHIKEIAKREYIDPAGGTVDYVLMFIPNEGIYSYLNREGEGIIDFAMEKKVLVCSPLTLYAVLSMIRQSVENFKMETRASELQLLMQTFKKQWILFAEKMERVGKSINQAQTHFQELESTRSKQLERPVDKILDLKLDRSEEADDKVVKKIEN